MSAIRSLETCIGMGKRGLSGGGSEPPGSLPLGVVYALWSGCTTVLTSLMDLIVFGQQLAFGQVLGIGLIVLGTAWLHLSLSGNDDEAGS